MRSWCGRSPVLGRSSRIENDFYGWPRSWNTDAHILGKSQSSGYTGPSFMESPTRTHFLDQAGNPLPDRIQCALDELVPKLRRKFSMIRDEVVLVEIMEQAGQNLLNREAR